MNRTVDNLSGIKLGISNNLDDANVAAQLYCHC